MILNRSYSKQFSRWTLDGQDSREGDCIVLHSHICNWSHTPADIAGTFTNMSLYSEWREEDEFNK